MFYPLLKRILLRNIAFAAYLTAEESKVTT
jgi:hypothetical protein